MGVSEVRERERPISVEIFPDLRKSEAPIPKSTQLLTLHLNGQRGAANNPGNMYGSRHKTLCS